MIKYFKINSEGCSICAKLYYNSGRQFERIVIAPHGFAGNKDSTGVRKFSEFLLSKYKNIAVVTYDHPCHGDDVRQHLCLNDCDMYMSNVIDYCRTALGAQELYAYATSFGGYLTLKYLLEHDNPFSKTVLRCPAVNMYDVLWNTIATEADKELLLKGKGAEVGFDNKVRIDIAFIDELRGYDIMQKDFLERSESILIINAGNDEVVPPEAVRKFADDNLIELVTVEKADHRFINPALMTEAVKAALAFYEL